jgi:hypothetical protein
MKLLLREINLFEENRAIGQFALLSSSAKKKKKKILFCLFSKSLLMLAVGDLAFKREILPICQIKDTKFIWISSMLRHL